MSLVATFYTPGTGLPDFEMRIALGLCAAALNVVEPKKIALKENYDQYMIEISDQPDASNIILKSLGWLCQNRLSDQVLLLRTPGFRPLHLDKQANGVAEFGKKLASQKDENANIFGSIARPRSGAHDYACGHVDSKDDKIFNALLAFSPQLGQPPKRNNPSHQITLPLCPYCGAAGLAGTVLFQMDISITNTKRSKKERFFFLPRFRGEATGDDLSKYLAATKHIRGNLEDIPAYAATIALLSLYPHLIDVLGGSVSSFFIGRLDNSGKAPRYGFYLEQPAQMEILYLRSVYNRAFAQSCYRLDDRSELLGLLAKALHNKDIKAALDLARAYVGETEGKALLPWSSTVFFATEVCKMDKALLDGEKFQVIKEAANMLQYFVRERNFGYIDNLRKARDADEFAKLFLDAQREAQSAMLDPKKQNNKPFLPGQNSIQSLLQLLNEDEKQFKSVQTLIALLAFTYYKKEA
jgi:hypothetical protein